MNSSILEIANSPMIWVLCAIPVAITLVQAILFTRLSRKAARELQVPDASCKQAFKTGMISSIGPSIGVFIVMVGLMAVIGSPMAWLRLSIIGAAPTELTAAQYGATAAGVEFGGADYTTETLALSWITMALNGAGWLLVTGLFAHKLEKVRDKVGGGDPRWIGWLSGAAMLGVFGNLNSTYVLTGGPTLVAVIGGALAMILLLRFVATRLPALKEYMLGIAMIIGMIAALFASGAIG